MKRLISSLALFLFAVSGAIAQQTIQSHQLENFYSVTLSGNVNVELIPAEENSIDIELYGADINKLKWSISNGTLSVSLRPTSGAKTRADVKVYYKDGLKHISVLDARLSAKEPIIAHSINISAGGGANLALVLDTQDLEFDITGNSVAQLSGSAKYMTMKATERSKVDSRQMNVVSAEVEGTLGSEIFVLANERLVANAKTNSTIFYAGNPPIFKDKSSKVNSSIGSSVLNIGHRE